MAITSAKNTASFMSLAALTARSGMFREGYVCPKNHTDL